MDVNVLNLPSLPLGLQISVLFPRVSSDSSLLARVSSDSSLPFSRPPTLASYSGMSPSSASGSSSSIARKTHRKTRAGCQTCKRRKIKCDEGRPCSRCRKFGLDYISRKPKTTREARHTVVETAVESLPNVTLVSVWCRTTYVRSSGTNDHMQEPRHSEHSFPYLDFDASVNELFRSHY